MALYKAPAGGLVLVSFKTKLDICKGGGHQRELLCRVVFSKYAKFFPTVNKVEGGEISGWVCCALCNACKCVFSAANALCIWAQPYKPSIEIGNITDYLCVSLLFSLLNYSLCVRNYELLNFYGFLKNHAGLT
jgi:hypothetical protein